MTCPKCSAGLPEWSEPGEWHHDDCPFESCDSAACRALKQPHTLADYVAAYEHWKTHSYLHGCSHGR